MVRGRRISDIDLLKKKLSKLINEGGKIREICPQVHYTAHKWSPLKLILLIYYMDMYSKIMSTYRNKLNISEIIYIDPLAGPGTNKIEETGDVIVGSPIISTIFSSNVFDRYFFAESNAEKREALQLRLVKLLQRDKFVIRSDCNELLDYVADYMDKLDGKVHFLMFVDCEGIEPKWDQMKKVLHYDGDLIFVFQTNAVWEQITRWRNLQGVSSFFGTEEYRSVGDRERLVEIYKEQIKSVETISGRRRELIDNIPVRGGIASPSFYYDVIFAAPKTRAGSPWFNNLLQYVKNRIAKHTGDSIKQALDILGGKSTQIDWFMTQ